MFKTSYRRFKGPMSRFGKAPALPLHTTSDFWASPPPPSQNSTQTRTPQGLRRRPQREPRPLLNRSPQARCPRTGLRQEAPLLPAGSGPTIALLVRVREPSLATSDAVPERLTDPLTSRLTDVELPGGNSRDSGGQALSTCANAPRGLTFSNVLASFLGNAAL